MKKKFLTIFFFIIIILGGGYFLRLIIKEKNVSSISVPPVQLPVAPEDAGNQAIQANEPSEPAPNLAEAIAKEIKLEAPFIVQAPFRNWSDPIFQNSCEEASLVMAMNWINEVKTISPAEAQKQILDIVDFENKTFGYNADTDVFDVEKIFHNFFNYQNIIVSEDMAMEDIINELQDGNLIMTPMFGQALGNPNYTAPGPIDHMLIITGYNPATKEFITNDPGTKRGSGYRYNENVLFGAIWGYSSGNDTPPPPTGALKKTMIVVRK